MVYARKQGRICTVFLDNNVPQPISSFEEEPIGFPMTYMGEEAVRAAFPGHEIRFVEQDRKEQPTAKRPPDSAVDKILRESASKVATTTNEGTPAPAYDTVERKLQERALQYFKILLAQYLVAAKGKQKELVLRAETAANVILAMWPEMIEELKAVRDSMKGFTL